MRLAVAALAVIVALPAAAQEPIPRTSDGKPDLQGYWSSEFITPLERPDGITALIVPPDKVDEAIKKMTPEIGEVVDPEIYYVPFPSGLLQMNGEFRSSTLIEPEDGKLPFTALAQAAAEQFDWSYDNPEDRPSAERCVDSLIYPPLRTVNMLIPMQIVQTPGALLFATEDMNPARIVTMTAPVLPEAVRSRAGQSRGRWEGDTLVIETDHFDVTHPTGIEWRDAALVTDDSRAVERFRMLSVDSMLYQFTVEDPSLYRKPWLAEYIIVRAEHPVIEYACHEGNHALGNILTAARMGLQKEDDD
jgi:hypothetical protein